MRAGRGAYERAGAISLAVLILGMAALVGIPQSASAINATLTVEVNEIRYADAMEALGLPPDWYFRIRVQDASGTQTLYSSIPIAPVTYDIIPVPTSEAESVSVATNAPTDPIFVTIELWDYDGILGGSPDPSDDSADISGETGGGQDDMGGQDAPSGASLFLSYYILRPDAEADHRYKDELGTWYDGCTVQIHRGDSPPDSSTGTDENDAEVRITICDDYLDAQGPPAPTPDDGISGCSKETVRTFSWSPPSDPSGIAGYSFQVNATPDSIVDTTGTSTTLSPQPDGSHTFYVRAFDHAGNWGSSGAHGFQVDTTGPAPPSPDDGISGWSNLNAPTFTWASATDMCGVAGYSWAVDGSPDETVDTTVPSASIPGQVDGVHTFSVRAVDTVGNWGDSGQHTFRIDTTPPSLSSLTWDSLPRDNTPSFSWTGSDEMAGIAGYSHSVDALPDAAIDTTGTSVQPGVVPDGPHEFYVRPTDGAGNWGTAASVSFLVDTSPPGAPAPDDGVSGWSADNTPIFSWAPVPDPNGIGGYSYEVDALPDETVDTTNLTAALPPQPDGPHQFCVTVRDGPGNWGPPGCHSFLIDTAAPAAPSPDDGVPAWSQDSTPTFVWSPPTDQSGIAGYSVSVDGSPDDVVDVTSPNVTVGPQADGLHIFYLKAVDAAGNWGAVGQHEFRIDTTGPSIPEPDDGVEGWSTNSTPTFSWAPASDPNAVEGYSYDVDGLPDDSVDTITTSVRLPLQADGLHEFCVKARDSLGNWGLAGCHPYQIDATAPAPPNPDDGAQDWSNVPTPTFAWSPPADAHSGVFCYAFAVDGNPDMSCDTGAVFVTLPRQTDGDHTFFVRARDTAGNWGEPGGHEFRIDTVAPSPPTPDDGVPDWTANNTPSFSWSAPTDAHSGVSCYAFLVDDSPNLTCGTSALSVTLPPQSDGRHTFYIRARDRAGNWGADVGQHEFKIDTVAPPAPNPDDGVPGWSADNTPTFSWAVPADTDSGTSCYSFSVDAAPATTCDTSDPFVTLAPQSDGSHIFRSRARDAAGNWGAAGQHEFLVDATPPQSTVSSLSPVQTSTGFAVSWSGIDGPDGSEIRGFDVQYRDGAGGVWTDWMMSTNQTAATFVGLDGHTYFFRSRGADLVGNLEVYPEYDGDASTTIQVPSDRGTVEGRVYDDATSRMLAGVVVRLGSHATVLTDGLGAYSATVPPGTHQVSAATAGYATSEATVSVATGGTTVQDFRLIPLPGWIVGIVTDGDSGIPLSGAQVLAGGREAVSSATGAFNVSVPPGAWIVTCWVPGYRPATASVSVFAAVEVIQDFQPSKVPVALLGTLTGHVFVRGTARPLSGAIVAIEGVGRVHTNASGAYDFVLEGGTYLVTVSKDGHDPTSKSVNVVAQGTEVADFELAPIVPGGDPSIPVETSLLPWALAVLVALAFGLFAVGSARRRARRAAAPQESDEEIAGPSASAIGPKCPFCGNEVAPSAARCPVCGGILT